MLLRVVLWYVGSGRGSVVSSVAGQVLWLNVYRVTRGHNSCQFAPPLGTRRNRGNLFSLARLSSRTETVFVLFQRTAPLGSLTLLVSVSPSSTSTPPLFFLFLLANTCFSFFVSSSCVLFPPLHPSCPPSHRDKGEVLLCCVFACLVAGLVVSKWGH